MEDMLEEKTKSKMFGVRKLSRECEMKKLAGCANEQTEQVKQGEKGEQHKKDN